MGLKVLMTTLASSVALQQPGWAPSMRRRRGPSVEMRSSERWSAFGEAGWRGSKQPRPTKKEGRTRLRYVARETAATTDEGRRWQPLSEKKRWATSSAGGEVPGASRRLPEKQRMLEMLGVDRKGVLRALTNLDQGEFRWELLTPWVKERKLTRVDKAIICSTFVAVAVGMQQVLEPRTDLAQHLSYVANFFSYTIGNQVGYRVIAIVASALEILAYDTEGGFVFQEDAIPDGYNVVFIVVNLYYVLRWALNKMDAVGGILEPLEEALYDRCFEPLGVGVYQYLKLLDLAEWVDVPRDSPPVAVTVEGEPVDELFVSIEGDFDVTTNGQRVASIPEFQIIGEVAMLENLQSQNGDFHQAARATVLAQPGSAFIKWPHAQLYALQASDAEFARAIQLAIARTLSHKLGSARRSAGALLEQQQLDVSSASSSSSSSSSSSDQETNSPAFNAAASTAGGGPRGASLSSFSPGPSSSIGRASNLVDEEDAVRVLPVVAPALERIYTACFLRRGFDDGPAFSTLVRAAVKGRAPPGGFKLDLTARMIGLTRGRAVVYDANGLKLQTINAPDVIGVAAFLEALFVFEKNIARSADADDALYLRFEPGAEFLSWNLRTLAPLLRTDSTGLRAALNRLYVSVVADDARNAQAIIAEQEPLLTNTLNATLA